MVRSILSIFIVVILVGATFRFAAIDVPGICVLPREYTVGEIDPRFKVSEAELSIVINEAEKYWEDAVGEDLFRADEKGAVVVNLIFDERQAQSNEEDKLRDQLDYTQESYEGQLSEHDQLVASYERESTTYNTLLKKYEARLDAYNRDVDRANRSGGADPREFERLQDEKQGLQSDYAQLEGQRREANAAADRANAAGERSSALIEKYNEGVEVYNEKFGEAREFTEGDYTQNRINIYQFDDRTELRLVLMHEMGHALGLGHTDNEKSIMYAILGKQNKANPTPSAEDIATFKKACAPWFSDLTAHIPGWERLQRAL